jgi:hypothetical protein
MLRRDSGRAGEPGGAAVVLEQIGQRERQVLEVGPEPVLGRGQNLGARVGAGELGGELPQRREPARADDPLGLLGDHAQHARDPVVVVGQRAVGERVVGLLRIAAALEEQEQRLVPGRPAGVEHGLDARPDVLPDLGPDLARRGAERPGLLDPERRPVGVVAEEGELVPPRHPHRVARAQHDPDDGLQALRPARDRPERGRRPVVALDARAHLAAAGGEIRRARARVGVRKPDLDQAVSLGEQSPSAPLAQNSRRRWADKLRGRAHPRRSDRPASAARSRKV